MYNFFPAWVVIAANVAVYAISAVLVGFLIWAAFALRAKRHYTVLVTAAPMLLLFYALGNAFKVAAVGPEFARYHLGDFGFPAALVLLIVTVHELVIRSKPAGTDEMSIVAHILKLNRLKMWIAVYAVALSVAYEWISGVLVEQLGNRPNSGVGRFDWIDVACYVFGGGIYFFCLFGANRILSKELAIHIEQLQRQRQISLLQTKADRVALRKGYEKPRKPHGVR